MTQRQFHRWRAMMHGDASSRIYLPRTHQHPIMRDYLKFPQSKSTRVAMESIPEQQISKFKESVNTRPSTEDVLEMATSQWDSQSNLLLLQLIYKYGDPYTPSATAPAATTPVFEQIAQQLTTHSLIRSSKRKFSASVFILIEYTDSKLCEEHYIDLLAQESLTREYSSSLGSALTVDSRFRQPLPQIKRVRGSATSKLTISITSSN